jgi:RNA polymerase sigma-70 factor, ECF subfamily
VPLSSPQSSRQERALRGGAGAGELEFSRLYDEWFDKVVVWLGSLGAPTRDREDLAQEVFVVVRRRLSDFDGRNVAGWLFQIARRQVLRHKRLVWFKRVFALGGDEPVEPDDARPVGPEASLERKQARAIVERLLTELSAKRRIVFSLFEIEGYSGEEIATLLDVPINTVWTRLHHARRDFHEALAAHSKTEQS